MGRAAVVLLGCALTFLVVACGSQAPAPPRPAPSSAAAFCAWYTPTIVNGEADGQQVIVTATGPACGSQALIQWVSAHSSGKPWATTKTAAGSTIIAQMAKAGTVIKIYQSGFAAQTEQTAGYLADAFQAAGWTVQVPSG